MPASDVSDGTYWNGTWGKHIKCFTFAEIKSFQKVRLFSRLSGLLCVPFASLPVLEEAELQECCILRKIVESGVLHIGVT